MKKIFLIITLLIFSVGVYCQDPGTAATVPSFDQLKKTKEKSDELIKDEKKGIKVSTWMNRGKMFLNAYEVNKGNLARFSPELSVKFVLKTEMEETTNEAGEKIWTYERIQLIFKDGNLDRWIESEKIVEDPLRECFSAYAKATEFDINGKKENVILDRLKELFNPMRENGLNYYLNEDYVNAIKAFQLSREVSEYKGVDIIDSASIYYGGIASMLIKDYDKAINFFKKSIDISFHNYVDGSSYKSLSECYIAIGDTVAAIATLKEGLEKAPENKHIIFSLINLYLNTNQDPTEIFTFIDLAKEKDPTNSSLYVVEGSLHEQLDNKEEAIKSYIKASEVDPENKDAFFNIGVINFNEAVVLSEEAEKIPVNKSKEYNAAKKKVTEEFMKALPYFEKAMELDNENLEILDILKTLYYRVQLMDKSKEMKEKIDSLKGK